MVAVRYCGGPYDISIQAKDFLDFQHQCPDRFRKWTYHSLG